MEQEKYNEITGKILQAAISVHREMGPGLLETVYEYCLCKELHSIGISAVNQYLLPLFYKGENLHKNFRIDILAEQKVLIEIKAVEKILPVHEAQVISYLKMADLKVGLLINFNVPVIRQGFRRFVNGFPDK
jgi:GxxExxY protein